MPGAHRTALDPHAQRAAQRQAREFGVGGRRAQVRVRVVGPLCVDGAIVERGLAGEQDLHGAVETRRGPDEQVPRLVVAGRPSVVRGATVGPGPRSDGEEVSDREPPRVRLPGRGQDHRARDVVAVRGDGVRRGEAERACRAVEDRAEHARPVRRGDAEPLDGAGGRDEAGRVAVGEERVVGDRGEVRLEVVVVRRRRHPRRRSRLAQGRELTGARPPAIDEPDQLPHVDVVRVHPSSLPGRVARLSATRVARSRRRRWDRPARRGSVARAACRSGAAQGRPAPVAPVGCRSGWARGRPTRADEVTMVPPAVTLRDRAGASLRTARE